MERDIYLYRAYIALNKFLVVLDEISASGPEHLRPLRTLAEYLGYPASRGEVLARLESECESIDPNNRTLLLVAATIYNHERKYDTTLRILNQSDHLEW